MNSSPVTTGAAAISGAMLSGVIIWLCSLMRVTPPPADVAGTLGAILLMGGHQLAVVSSRRLPASVVQAVTDPTTKAVAMIILPIALAVSLLLSACSSAQTQQAAAAASVGSAVVSAASSANPTVANIVAVVCKFDGAVQPLVVNLAAPIAAAVDPAAAPLIAGAVALDQTALHPAVVAACPQGSTAAGGVPG